MVQEPRNIKHSSNITRECILKTYLFNYKTMETVLCMNNRKYIFFYKKANQWDGVHSKFSQASLLIVTKYKKKYALFIRSMARVI